MSEFLERQDVRRKKAWLVKLRKVERVLVSLAIVFVGLACVYGIYLLIFFSSAFGIERVEVVGEWYYLDAAELAELSGVKVGDNLFQMPVSKIHERLRSNPWVKSVAVRRSLPDTLWIFVEEYHPAAILAHDGLHYVDDEGSVFKQVEVGDDVDFPVFSGDIFDGANSEGATQRMCEMIDIAKDVRDRGIGDGITNVAEVHLDSEDGYSIILSKDPKGAAGERMIQVLLGRSAIADRIDQIDKAYDAISERGGRIRYIVSNEPRRVIVGYGSS